MKTDNKFILEKLISKSNIIVGFVILQSITFGYKLGDPVFTEKVKGYDLLVHLLLISHLIILVGSIISVFIIGKKQNQYMEITERKALSPVMDIWIKCVLILIYGPIPVVPLMTFILEKYN